MPRTVRVAPAGVIFHVLNRANARARIFEKDLDYEAFRRIIGETANLIPWTPARGEIEYWTYPLFRS